MDPATLAAQVGQLDISEMPLQGTRPPHFRADMSPDEIQRAIREYQEWFEQDRQVSPGPAPYIDRDSLIEGQISRRRQHERHFNSRAGVQWYMSIVGFAKHSSSAPLEALERVNFSQMLVRKVHIGSYLLCRTITPCIRLTSIQMVVEDPEGVAQNLSIYNFPTTLECSLDYLDLLFPLGTVIAIREPTFKAATQGPCPFLRVDTPTDIAFIGPHSPLLNDLTWHSGTHVPRSLALPETVESWRERGNAYFKASDWLPAAIAYSHGLALDPDAAVLLSNRSEAFLRLNYFSGALHDARRILSMTGIAESLVNKAWFRAGKAEYARGQYDAAEASFVQWQRGHPEDPAVLEWITRSQQRLAEKRTGNFDWAEMFRISQKEKHLDVADYQGPLAVGNMDHYGGGRGMVSTRDIGVGELLLVSKPFVAIYAEDLSDRQVVMSVDLISKTMNKRTGSAALSRIVEKMYGNPDTHDLVYHLRQPGDVMIIRATAPIQAGSEITLRYTAEISYVARHAVLRKHMIASCDCQLCKEDQNDGEAAIQRRHELYTSFSDTELQRQSLAELRSLEQELMATCVPSRSAVRPMTATVQHAIAEKIRSLYIPGTLSEAIEEDMKALESFGFVVLDRATSDDSAASPDQPVFMMVRIAWTFLLLNDEGKAVCWLKAALWLFNASIGGGKELFMLVLMPILSKMDMQSFGERVL
ncbi:Small glutamine-rich tetratricopeptide repeat-containing protein beta [Grifola frondosa]|uniref:Small glutamine-rich tetratricopeptide repeat-containing protein beta n=1 Tax=Grifola frondosa TaxID=5627 RepID=A0A1C7MIS2_GRIFR|nr:Small glutamine-rich tetratricopeptide repeat-containing protein beta [Grifola frondosa]